MKKIILIIGGVIFIAIAGRAIWAWQQVRNEEARVRDTPAVVSTIMPKVAEVKNPIVQSIEAASTTATSIIASSDTPMAKLTVNGVATVTAKEGENLTLNWSSANADKFSSTQSTSKCFVTSMNRTETVTSNISSARGIDSSLVFTKDDLAFLAGCDMGITYIVKNSKTAKEARATVHVLLPKNSETTKQLINIMSSSTKN